MFCRALGLICCGVFFFQIYFFHNHMKTESSGEIIFGSFYFKRENVMVQINKKTNSTSFNAV